MKAYVAVQQSSPAQHDTFVQSLPEITMPISLPAASDQLVNTHKAAYDHLLSLINVSLAGAEKLAALNISAARSALTEQVDHAKNLLGAKDLQSAFALHSAASQPQVEKAIAYSRSIYEISAETQEELVKLFEQGHAELNKSIGSALDWYAKSSANSDVAVAAVKSALSAANSAFENVNKAARQVADITEAGVSAATNATVRAVGSVSPPSRKKAA